MSTGEAGLNRQLLDAREQERARLARELHDDIAQRLAVAAIEIAGSTCRFSAAPTICA